MTAATEAWFQTFSGHPPYGWQVELLAGRQCENRLIRVPTGFGKTLGVVGAWAFHRAVLGDPSWPRRLVFCLPMRVLVEQTVDAVEDALERAGLLAGPSRSDGVCRRRTGASAGSSAMAALADITAFDAGGGTR